MKRFIIGLALLPALAIAQTVPNGGITLGQVWSVPQWVSAWQSKADTGNALLPGNQSPSAGGLMQIDHLLEITPSGFFLQNEGGVWPSTAYAFVGISKEVTASTVSGQGSSGPLVGLFAFLNNNGATAPAVALLPDCVARTANSICFGANIIARNASVNGTKLIGLEIDLEPAAGTTISNQSIGLVMNTFSIATPAPAIQLGGIAGGTWANGYVGSHTTGAHLSVQSGDPTTSVSFMDTTNGTFSSAAVKLGTGASQAINLGGGSFGTSPYVYGDSSGNLIANMGTGGFVIFQRPGGAQAFAFDQFGGISANGAMAIKTSGVAAINITTGQVVSTTQPLQLPNYTVATLPACNATLQYSMAAVTDATAPAYNAALTGGGAVKIPVFCTGSAWTAH